MAITHLSKETSRNDLSFSEGQPRKEHETIKSKHPKVQNSDIDVSDLPKVVEKKPASIAKLSGIDLKAIDQGIIRVRIPLIGGKVDFPGPFADAVVKVKNNSVAHFDLGIGKKKGQTVITGASIKFLPAIRIKNPASSLNPTKKTFVTRLFDVDYLKDKVADIVLSGVQISKNGQIHLDGHVKFGLFGKKDLNQLIPKGSLPKINLSIEALQNHDGVTSLDLERLLRSIGSVAGEASFTIEGHTEPRQMDFDALGIHAWTDTSCAQVSLQGKASLTRQNSFHINIDPDESEIHLQDGKVSLGGEIRIGGVAQKAPDIQSHIAFSIDPHPIHASFKVSELTTLQLDLPKGGNRISGHAFIFRDADGKITLKDASSISATVAGKVNGDLTVRTEHIKANLKHGYFQAQVNANMSLDKSGATIHSGKAHATVGAYDLSTSCHGVKVFVPGEFQARIDAQHLQYSPADKAPASSGSGYVSFETNNEGAIDSNLQSNFTFDLQKDATLRLELLNRGVTEFLKPYSDLVLPLKKGAYKPGVDSAPIGSSAFRKRCEDIGGAKIRRHDHVELLIDGVSSLPKRLELIKGAKKSLCMQTMVLKNDESGSQIATALCEAASRGVDVRVIVDALGNSTSLMDVVGMSPVYQRLQSGGVKLEIHNNSIGFGVRKVLNALSTSPRVGDLLNFEDLINPDKLIASLNLVIGAAVGESELNLDESSKRELVEGLSLILTGGKSSYSPEIVNRFAQITKDNILELAEVLELLKQNAHLNFRWHEKYLIADEKTAIVGGLNTADEYLLGGGKQSVKVRSKVGETWRDTDVLIKGQSAQDAFGHFADNWRHLTNQSLDPSESQNSVEGNYKIQMVHSRPRINGDSHIRDLIIECLGSLSAGQKAYFENAYFLPTGGAQEFEDALISAAQRGVDVRVLINSHDTIDVKPVAEGAVFSERRLLENGVRVFERTGDRMMHSKVSTFGEQVSVVGSWNGDNRSSSLNSESAAFIHSHRFAQKIERMIEDDMNEGVAREIHLEEIEHLPLKEELRNVMSANFADFL